MLEQAAGVARPLMQRASRPRPVRCRTTCRWACASARASSSTARVPRAPGGDDANCRTATRACRATAISTSATATRCTVSISTTTRSCRSAPSAAMSRRSRPSSSTRPSIRQQGRVPASSSSGTSTWARRASSTPATAGAARHRSTDERGANPGDRLRRGRCTATSRRAVTTTSPITRCCIAARCRNWSAKSSCWSRPRIPARNEFSITYAVGMDLSHRRPRHHLTTRRRASIHLTKDSAIGTPQAISPRTVFLAFLAYFGTGLGVLALAARRVSLVTPHSEITLIRAGNTAAAIAFAGIAASAWRCPSRRRSAIRSACSTRCCGARWPRWCRSSPT